MRRESEKRKPKDFRKQKQSLFHFKKFNHYFISRRGVTASLFVDLSKLFHWSTLPDVSSLSSSITRHFIITCPRLVKPWMRVIWFSYFLLVIMVSFHVSFHVLFLFSSSCFLLRFIQVLLSHCFIDGYAQIHITIAYAFSPKVAWYFALRNTLLYYCITLSQQLLVFLCSFIHSPSKNKSFNCRSRFHRFVVCIQSSTIQFNSEFPLGFLLLQFSFFSLSFFLFSRSFVYFFF